MIEDFETFLKLHEAQLKISGVPEHFYRALYDKLRRDILDAGEHFALLQVDYDGEDKGPYDAPFKLQIISESMKATDPKNIYLIDHLWTFEIENAKKQLNENESLRQRLANLMGLDTDATDTVFKEIWKYSDIYFYAKAEAIEQKQSFWFVNDEVGSAVTHSDEPNFRMVPFYYIPRELTYSLLFPIMDVEQGDYATKNRHETKLTPLYHKAWVLPWQYHDFTVESSDHYTTGPEYFSQGHKQETLPDVSILPARKAHYKVFAQYSVLKQNLTQSQYELTEDENEADILWYSYHFTDYKALSETSNKFVNQFPFEHVLTVKDLLAITCRRMGEQSWLPVSYNLREELPNFISYFQKREKECGDNKSENVWIIKPYNLARGLDIHITDDINFIIRLASTGPKIAQRYITHPVLFHRDDISSKVKFDIRYIVLLKSVKPLEVYVYKNFFLRFANRAFELNNYDTYEQHFTVMNYKSDVPLKKMLCADFKREFNVQYPNNHWDEAEQKIYKIMKQVFECATVEKPPMGIGESPQSRTLFGFDVMLEWNAQNEIQPVLLEVNWIPDCQRACDYYPDFYNDIFNVLFLDKINHDVLQAV